MVEQLSIDLSGIDISGSGRIIMDNSGTVSTTGNISWAFLHDC